MTPALTVSVRAARSGKVKLINYDRVLRRDRTLFVGTHGAKIAIVNRGEKIVEMLPLKYGATLFFDDGAIITAGDIIMEWLPDHYIIADLGSRGAGRARVTRGQISFLNEGGKPLVSNDGRPVKYSIIPTYTPTILDNQLVYTGDVIARRTDFSGDD
jgi:hypothetical protein